MTYTTISKYYIIAQFNNQILNNSVIERIKNHHSINIRGNDKIFE